MSVIGSNLAGAIASTTVTSDQLARQRDRQQMQAAEQSHRLRDALEHSLEALEDEQPGPASADLAIDSQLPQDQKQEQPSRRRRRNPAHLAQDSGTQPPPQAQLPVSDGTPPAPAAAPLYRHLDIRA